MSQPRGNVALATFPRGYDRGNVAASRECRLRRSRELRHSRGPQALRSHREPGFLRQLSGPRQACYSAATRNCKKILAQYTINDHSH